MHVEYSLDVWKTSLTKKLEIFVIIYLNEINLNPEQKSSDNFE